MLRGRARHDDFTGLLLVFHVDIIPADVVDRAQHFLDGGLSVGGVLSFCRHNFSDYDEVVASIQDPHELAAMRHYVNGMIMAALAEAGVDVEAEVIERIDNGAEK